MTRQQNKRRRARGTQAKLARKQQSKKARCPGKGGAKRSAGAYASDFYAGPVVPPGARRGPQYRVTDEEDVPAGPACSDRTALFTPPQKCAVARRPEQRQRLPRLWVCAAHQHRQCASCAAVGRGVRHCCARGHTGHPRPPMALWGQQRGARQAEVRNPRVGGTPSAKRRKRQRALAPGLDRVRPHKRRRVDVDPPPPYQEDHLLLVFPLSSPAEGDSNPRLQCGSRLRCRWGTCRKTLLLHHNTQERSVQAEI